MVYKLLIFNSSLFILDSAMDGYLKIVSSSFLFILYFCSLADVVFFAYIFRKRQKEMHRTSSKTYYRNIRGYTCLEHHLYNMDYIQATSHFGWKHNITLDEVEDE